MARADQLQVICVHWRGSPLWRAMFAPPSVTPRAAAMPRSALRSASLPVRVADALGTSIGETTSLTLYQTKREALEAAGLRV